MLEHNPAQGPSLPALLQRVKTMGITEANEIVSRLGLVVSDKVAAGAVPIIGAVGGATVNVVIMGHFQRIARGHFTLRRLERSYRAADVRRHYAELAAVTPRLAR